MRLPVNGAFHARPLPPDPEPVPAGSCPAAAARAGGGRPPRRVRLLRDVAELVAQLVCAGGRCAPVAAIPRGQRAWLGAAWALAAVSSRLAQLLPHQRATTDAGDDGAYGRHHGHAGAGMASVAQARGMQRAVGGGLFRAVAAGL